MVAVVGVEPTLAAYEAAQETVPYALPHYESSTF